MMIREMQDITVSSDDQPQPRTTRDWGGPYRAPEAEKNRVNESDGGTDVVQGPLTG